MTYNPPIRLYINKIENRVIFKSKTGYYFELLTAETMKLLRTTKNKITKNKKNLWRRGVVVIITTQLSEQSLNTGSAQVQILLAVCRRFTMVRISDNGPSWK